MNEPEKPVDAPTKVGEKERLAALARAVDTILNGKGTPSAERKTGFVLMVFDLPDCHRCTMMSSVSGQLTKEMLRAQQLHLEEVETGGKMAGSENSDLIKH